MSATPTTLAVESINAPFQTVVLSAGPEETFGAARRAAWEAMRGLDSAGFRAGYPFRIGEGWGVNVAAPAKKREAIRRACVDALAGLSLDLTVTP